MDLNPSERRHAACCGRGFKNAPSVNFDRAWRQIQIEDGFITTTENAEDMQENEGIVALDPSQESEEKQPGSSIPVV